MKKLLSLLAVFVLAFNFTSCSNDDDKPKTMQQKLIGKWEYYRHIHPDDSESHEIGNECATKREFLEIKKNNNSTYGYYNSDCELSSWDYTYTFDNTTNIISFVGEYNWSEKVLEVTSNTLKLDDGDGYYYELRKAN